MLSPSVNDDSVRLDLNEHGWIDQGTNLEHGRCRPDLSEHFPVSLGHLLPIRLDIHDIHSRANQITETRTRLLEAGFDVLQRLDSLGVSVAGPDNLTLLVCRCGL